jgi:uncharacterized lipoprotein YmbA
MRRAPGLAIVLVLLGGCLARDASAPRYFRPDAVSLDASVDPRAEGVPVRLRSVRAADFLRERVVWRSSEVEYGMYEQRRWIELPVRYVERAIEGTIARTPGLRLTDAARAATLEVYVSAFDELLAPVHAAAVELTASLRDERRALLFEQRFATREPIAGRDLTAVPQAMGRALDRVAADVAEAVAARLARTERHEPHATPAR